MPRTHRHFPGRYPLSNRYFVNRSRWLLSNTVVRILVNNVILLCCLKTSLILTNFFFSLKSTMNDNRAIEHNDLGALTNNQQSKLNLFKVRYLSIAL